MGSLTCGVMAIMVGKAKQKPLQLPLPGKTVNQSQHLNPGGIPKISATIKDLKAADMFPPHLPLTVLSGQCGRQMDHGVWQLIIQNPDKY